MVRRRNRSHRQDTGLLAMRLCAGGVLAAHGSQKLFGWFGGGGPHGTAAAMEGMGFKPGLPSAIAAGAGEAGGGALLALGLASPAAGAAAAGAMAGAVAVHAPAGFFAMSGGFEYPAYLGATAAAIGLAGPGRYSLDSLVGDRLNRPWMVPVAFAASAVATAMVVRRRAAAQATDEPAEASSDAAQPA